MLLTYTPAMIRFSDYGGLSRMSESVELNYGYTVAQFMRDLSVCVGVLRPIQYTFTFWFEPILSRG